MDNELLQAISGMFDEKLNSALSEQLKPIKDDIASMQTDITELKAESRSTNAIVVKLETSHDKAIKLIREGHLDLNEKLNVQGQRLDKIERHLDRLDTGYLVHDAQIEKLAK